ncbi:MAG: hypothetical protein HYV09_32440 [Deltaproteobacteria bacterium]|nr:hypothetical protein [Deltaproteobacteria bacterium]
MRSWFFRHVDDPRIRAVTFDVFDTVLLRNTKPERLRFFEIASELTIELAARGYPVSKEAAFHARALSHEIAYRTAPMNRFQREAKFEDIGKLVARALSLSDPSLVDVIQEVELRYEEQNLRGNRAIIELLAEARSRGKKLFFLSDMYLSNAQVRRLLARAAADLTVDGGYVSSESSLSKHAGGLFDLFCESEGFAPHELLHVGDNAHSDVASPRAKGWNALHLPRGKAFQWARAARELHTTALLKRLLP